LKTVCVFVTFAVTIALGCSTSTPVEVGPRPPGVPLPALDGSPEAARDAEVDALSSSSAPPDGGDARDAAVVTRTTCPPGPFALPSVQSSTTVCADFAFKYDWSEGPTWVGSRGAFFFSNFTVRSPTGGDIIKYTPGAGCEIFLEDVGCNGLAVTLDGNLFAACHQSRSLVRIDVETREVTTVVDNYMGMMFDSPNDVVVHSNGTLYFTNPNFELGNRPRGVGLAVFRLDPAGALTMIAMSACNGIALSPDERKLYVLQAGVWDLDASGVPSNRTNLFTSGDGMAVDCAGNLYASGGIFSASGERLGDYGPGTNLAFGGPEGKTVLVAGPGSQVRELQMNIPGLP
jgi:gluconolactonase